jgi:hypothetical protein
VIFVLLTLLPLLWGCSANEPPLAGTPVDPAVLFEHSTFADAALELEVRCSVVHAASLARPN